MVVVPIISTGLRLWSGVREYKKRYRQARQAATGEDDAPFDQEQRTWRQAEGIWTYPLKRKKKVFAREDGEYISFKEVKGSALSHPPVYQETIDQVSATRVDQKVTDTDWEEMK